MSRLPYFVHQRRANVLKYGDHTLYCSVHSLAFINRILYGGNQISHKNSTSYLGLDLKVLALEVILTLLVAARHR